MKRALGTLTNWDTFYRMTELNHALMDPPSDNDSDGSFDIVIGDRFSK